MSTKRVISSCLLAAAAAAGLTLAAAAPASAHVTVQPGEATAGGYAKLAFRVPNESASAGTIGIQVTFPQDTPFSSVRTMKAPGWTATVVKVPLNPPVTVGEREYTEAVQTVTWTADPGVRVGPDEFAEFEVSLGPLPTGVEQLVLPTKQTYDDGEIVDWNAPPPADGAAEPDRPAPVLNLVAAEESGDGHGHDAAASPGDGAAPDATDAGASSAFQSQLDIAMESSTDDTARWLAGIGLAVGALGLGVGIGAIVAARRRPQP